MIRGGDEPLCHKPIMNPQKDLVRDEDSNQQPPFLKSSMLPNVLTGLVNYSYDNFQFDLNGRMFSKTGRKHCGKRRNCS